MTMVVAIGKKNSRQKSTRQKDNEQKSAEVLLKEAYVVEPVSFNILEPNKVKVVIKQSSPSFETRQLKQWLSHTGNSVKVFRSEEHTSELQSPD